MPREQAHRAPDDSPHLPPMRRVNVGAMPVPPPRKTSCSAPATSATMLKHPLWVLRIFPRVPTRPPRPRLNSFKSLRNKSVKITRRDPPPPPPLSPKTPKLVVREGMSSSSHVPF